MWEGGKGAAEEERGDLNDGADSYYGKPVCVVLAGEVLECVMESERTADARTKTTISSTCSLQARH